MRAIGIIPARLQSSRLPRKLLLDETGLPLIQYAWQQASKASMLSEIIVATDSPEIAECVTRFGGRAEMTGEHPSGTDRIAEVVRRCGDSAEIIVNIQGDEPDIDPASLDQLVELLASNPSSQMATLASPITTREEWEDNSCTKVVFAGGGQSSSGRALYFSRHPIPFARDRNVDDLLADPAGSPWHLHIGVYAYRRDFLLELTNLPPSRLERLEKLEQLRALEAGAEIQVCAVEHRSVGIDTPDDYAQFVARQRGAA
ncbi:MAG: 3-deoxy-manno-octulosonate cytidylyltransferase [Planctomycetaceae bacterium]|nr:3-deoxy-manno-octulosonate cytidylyltransferase [Planctomycetaceae bacterium]